MDWSKLSIDEIERRRIASTEALKREDRAEFDRYYQEHCDRIYWTHGQCCAGCDHWQTEGGGTGLCGAAGIVSGEEVLRSMGMSFCSYIPPPGLPASKIDFHCGKFKDDFDWSTLDHEYLRTIGAFSNGELKPKPSAPSTR